MGKLTCQLELHEANKETPSMPTTVNALIAPHTSLLTHPPCPPAYQQFSADS
ncbi:hypothetical protein N9V84_02445 [Verrucomicrobiales bacterium]|nr:hypothetical protein [Verrucomicrobiales bacterium]